MSKEAAESRIKQLEQAIEQSKSDIEQRHANHNALIGALNEAKNMLSLIFEESVKEDEEKGPEVV